MPPWIDRLLPFIFGLFVIMIGWIGMINKKVTIHDVQYKNIIEELKYIRKKLDEISGKK